MDVPSLRYGGREMLVGPMNASLDDTARRLVGRQTVIAELEPGDGTYYSLLIVPAWAGHVAPHLGRFGIQEHIAHRFLIVTKLDDQVGHAFYATADVGEWDLPRGIDNEWTRELLVWWLRVLWQNIQRLREGGV